MILINLLYFPMIFWWWVLHCKGVLLSINNDISKNIFIERLVASL